MIAQMNAPCEIPLQPLTPELLRRYDIPGPRYTSYPTADRFVEAFTEEDYKQSLMYRRESGFARPLSLYVHIPFCQSLCFYCACNKIITKHHERGTEYLRYLSREIDLHVHSLGGDNRSRSCIWEAGRQLSSVMPN
jgi:oxygen-independent coproporphyrinogen-3 oxidase